MTRKIIFISIIITLLFRTESYTQILFNGFNTIDYANPKEYQINKISFSGKFKTDTNICKLLTGLYEGQTILVPGDEITKAIKNLWEQGMFDNITVYASIVNTDLINLNIFLVEHPRLAEQPRFSSNISKSEVDNLRELLNLNRGDFVNKNTTIKCCNAIKKYYADKGFYNAEVKVEQIIDSTGNKYTTKLNFDIQKNNKIRVNRIYFSGNDQLTQTTLLNKLKKTKQRTYVDPFTEAPKFIAYTIKSFFKPDTIDITDYTLNYINENIIVRLFKSAKFNEDDFLSDKQNIINKYNELGFRDAKIISDTLININDKFLDIKINIAEGQKYYFRNIKWVGNTKYKTETLNSILKIKKGDVYNNNTLETNLNYNPNSLDISSLYMDDGYLFFSATPIEVNVENDSVDIEIRIIEGKQAYINKVSVSGNTKTNDRVIIREIRSQPGQLFSRSDVIRTTRELAQLRYFDPEKIIPDIKPNPTDGTVDIEYIVQETSTDQLELQGGWGMGRIVGTLGVSFNNFSTRNFFNKRSWRPLPSGDGQKLSIRAQSNGTYYQAYNASFTEPWLGGKKPNAFSITGFYSIQSNGLPNSDSTRQAIYISGISVGLGKRLKWPDDYFSISWELSYRNYKLQNYYSTFSYSSGTSKNVNGTMTIARNSIDHPYYPRTGSELLFSLQATPPYSLINKLDYSTATDQEKYEWIEYHKWKFYTSWFAKLAGNLVINTRTKFGFLGLYNREIGIAPFERFYLGGDGLSGFALDGRELIGLRGYSNNSLTPRSNLGYVGGTIFNKYTLELRYPISLNPMATVFVLGFAEAGNSWVKFNQFNPFDVKRSAGVGVRIFLPMFGLLGLDWGYGFDEIPGDAGANKGQFHFSINQSID